MQGHVVGEGAQHLQFDAADLVASQPPHPLATAAAVSSVGANKWTRGGARDRHGGDIAQHCLDEGREAGPSLLRNEGMQQRVRNPRREDQLRVNQCPHVCRNR